MITRDANFLNHLEKRMHSLLVTMELTMCAMVSLSCSGFDHAGTKSNKLFPYKLTNTFTSHSFLDVGRESLSFPF